MEDNGKNAVEIAMRGVVTGIVEDTIENEFVAGYDVQKDGIKTPIRNLVEGALSDTVEQGRLGTILINYGDKWENSARFKDALTRRVVRNKSLVAPITAIVKKRVEKVAQDKKSDSSRHWNMS